MRRSDRAITEMEEIRGIMNRCKICRIAMVDQGRPYIVPLSFGYRYEEGHITLYFHSALEGRKIAILKENPNVCIEMDCDDQLVVSEIPCKNSTLYASIIGEGSAVFIEETKEKKEALNELMKHMVGKAFNFEDAMVKGVAVFKVTLTSISAKSRKA